jgi:hypothetical protein
MEDYRCWNKHGEEGINEADVRDSYMERGVPTGVEEDHDDVNEIDILGFTDDDIVFQVHNIEEMVCTIKRHDDDDQYSNSELAKYKKCLKTPRSYYIMVMRTTGKRGDHVGHGSRGTGL